MLAFIGEIDPKIHEVILAEAGQIKDLLEFVLVEFVRNITKHYLSRSEFIPSTVRIEYLRLCEHQDQPGFYGHRRGCVVRSQDFENLSDVELLEGLDG